MIKELFSENAKTRGNTVLSIQSASKSKDNKNDVDFPPPLNSRFASTDYLDPFCSHHIFLKNSDKKIAGKFRALLRDHIREEGKQGMYLISFTLKTLNHIHWNVVFSKNSNENITELPADVAVEKIWIMFLIVILSECYTVQY